MRERPKEQSASQEGEDPSEPKAHRWGWDTEATCTERAGAPGKNEEEVADGYVSFLLNTYSALQHYRLLLGAAEFACWDVILGL